MYLFIYLSILLLYFHVLAAAGELLSQMVADCGSPVADTKTGPVLLFPPVTGREDTVLFLCR